MESNKTLIRAVIALYAALVGFGLKKMLDPIPVPCRCPDPSSGASPIPSPSGVSDINDHRWWLFVILLLLAFRIMCGASVHLADIYANEKFTEKKQVNRLVVDIFSLIGFAMLILSVTLATDLVEFYKLLMLPFVGMCLWGLSATTIFHDKLAKHFYTINLVSLAVVASFWLFEQGDMRKAVYFDWHFSVMLVAVGSLFASIFDVRVQVSHLAAAHKDPASSGSAKT